MLVLTVLSRALVLLDAQLPAALSSHPHQFLLNLTIISVRQIWIITFQLQKTQLGDMNQVIIKRIHCYFKSKEAGPLLCGYRNTICIG